VIGAAGIEAVGVVVPAHNEETLLPACLAALGRVASGFGMPVWLLVVADTCTDRTAAVARACGARVIAIGARNVGAARAAGMAELLRLTAGVDPSAVWLATTDADTVVPPGWLERQLRYAGQGWDVVLGTVTVADWDGHPPHVPAASMPCISSATDRTRMFMVPTWASGRRPTWRPADSGRCAPPRTTRCSPPPPKPAAPSCRPATSPSRPQRAAAPARRSVSATCCTPWPEALAGGVPSQVAMSG